MPERLQSLCEQFHVGGVPDRKVVGNRDTADVRRRGVEIVEEEAADTLPAIDHRHLETTFAGGGGDDEEAFLPPVAHACDDVSRCEVVPEGAVVGGPCRCVETDTLRATVGPDVAVTALGFRHCRVESLSTPFEPRLHRHDARIRLELGERQIEQMSNFALGMRAHEIDRHVVRRPECRGQSERLVRGVASNLVEGNERTPDGHGMAERVDATSARSPRQLREVGGLQGDVTFPGVAGQLVDHDGARGHVDADCERLGRKDNFHETFGERLFDKFFEGRNETRVVRCDARTDQVDEALVIERSAFFVGETRRVPLGDRTDAARLGARDERQRVAATRLCRVVALVATENEVDRGQ